MIFKRKILIALTVSVFISLLTSVNSQSEITNSKMHIYSGTTEYGRNILIVIEENNLGIFETANFKGPRNRVVKATYSIDNKLINIKPEFEYTYSTNTGIVRSAFINCKFEGKVEYSKEIIIYNGYKLMIDKKNLYSDLIKYPYNKEELISMVKKDSLINCENRN